MVVSEEEDEVVRPEDLPMRLFALDHYPTKTKVNGYSRPEYLALIASRLKGTKEMDFLLNSPFGYLFKIPPNKTSFSGKLVLEVICRQIVTKRQHEMWFIFAGQPIKLGLREFAILTGLNCEKYPDEKEVETLITVEKGKKSVWSVLFKSKDENPTMDDVVKKFCQDDSVPMWMRLSLALIIIVDGVLTCSTQPVRPVWSTVEMTKSLDFFCKYPWGRLSFERTFEMITGFRENTNDVEGTAAAFKQKSIGVHGFPLALQLLAFTAVPSLAALAPDDVDQEIFTQRSIHNLAKLRPIHTSNIMACEAEEKVTVHSILPSDVPPICDEWDDEVEDTKVILLENLILSGYKFEENMWLGGDDECPKVPRPKKPPPTGIKRKRLPKEKVVVKKAKTNSKEKASGEGDKDDEEEQFDRFTVELNRCFRKQDALIKKEVEGLKQFVRDEICNALLQNEINSRGKEVQKVRKRSGKSPVKSPVKSKKRKSRLVSSTKRSSRGKKRSSGSCVEIYPDYISEDEEKEPSCGDKCVSPTDQNCPMDCFLRYGPVYNVCNDCYLWWCARRIFQMF